MLDSVITQRRKGEGFQQDFLQSLLKKHSKDNTEEADDDKLTDKQLKDNILTLLVAGHDTTTAALTWVVKFLAENPSALQRLRVISFYIFACLNYIMQQTRTSDLRLYLQEEHQKIQSSREDGSSLTWSDVNNMPYTTKVNQRQSHCFVEFMAI